MNKEENDLSFALWKREMTRRLRKWRNMKGKKVLPAIRKGGFIDEKRVRVLVGEEI